MNLTSQKINISTGERQALKEFSRNKRNLIKVNTTVLMSRQDKLNEGQVLLDDLNNYRPLDKPMVKTIDKTTAKWLSLTREIIIKPME